jgi:hypothetical protein
MEHHRCMTLPSPLPLRAPLARLVARRPIPPALRPAAGVWVQRSHRPFGRLSSPEVAAVAFALSLLAYLLSGIAAFGFVAMAMIAVFIVAMATWGGIRSWERRDRVDQAAAARRAAVVTRRVRRANVQRLAAAEAAAARRRTVVTGGLVLGGLWLGPELILRLSRPRHR